MFFCIGVLSMLISKNTSPYAVIMLVGLGLGWIGDYFLHAKPSNTYFAIGFISFLLGHVVYIGCFTRALPKLFEGYNQFDLTEIIAGVSVLAVAFFIAIFVIKMKFNPAYYKYAVIVYAFILITMVVKSASLGIRCYLSGAENGLLSAIVLSAGSVLFLLSDASLAVILFGGYGKSYPLKIFNIVTYFWGQVLLASSILFINI